MVASVGHLEATASTASPTSRVVALPPRSGVGASASAASTARSSASASSGALEAVAEHERDRAEHRGRVRDALPGDLRRRAVDGLEEARAVVSERRGPASPRPPVTAAATSERMSPNVFSVRTTSIVSGACDDRHRERVDERVVERHVGVLGRAELGDDVAPEPRRVQDVHLVDRREPAPAARARARSRASGDALDLGPRVLAGVEPGAVVARPLRAEVEAADELADDDEVDPRSRCAGRRFA